MWIYSAIDVVLGKYSLCIYMWNYFDVFYHNTQFVNKLPKSKEFLHQCLRNTKTFQSQSIPIIKLMQGIIDKDDSSVTKAKKIHDWIAMHIFYDKDVVRNGIYLQMDISALESLLNKRCVCSGYSNLSVALLRSAGIPSIGVTCIAKTNRWLTSQNKNDVNHEVCMAFIDNNWSFIDVTWDSPNVYENGKFVENEYNKISYKYFTCNISSFSRTHKLIGCILE